VALALQVQVVAVLGSDSESASTLVPAGHKFVVHSVWQWKSAATPSQLPLVQALAVPFAQTAAGT
jgi:hypothetical protein